MRVAPTIVLSEDERTTLTKLSKSKTTSVRSARCAKDLQLSTVVSPAKDRDQLLFGESPPSHGLLASELEPFPQL